MLPLLLALTGPPTEPVAVAAEPPLPAAVEALLDDPDATLRTVPPGHRVVALSLVAESCADLGRSDCAARAAEIAVDRAPAGMLATGQNLYAAHLLIALSAAAATGRDVDPDLSARLSDHLAAASLADPLHTTSSYGDEARWPADQAAVLHALWLDDRVRGTEAHEAPARAWLGSMATRGTDPVLGLHVSELTGTEPHASQPRGCALSWTVRYSAGFAPEVAAELWTRYRAAFLVELGEAAGLREWAPGVELPADLDSGPIVAGVGASATALGIGAARAVGDEHTARRLESAEALGRLAAGDHPQADTALAAAILFRGHTPVAQPASTPRTAEATWSMP